MLVIDYSTSFLHLLTRLRSPFLSRKLIFAPNITLWYRWHVLTLDKRPGTQIGLHILPRSSFFNQLRMHPPTLRTGLILTAELARQEGFRRLLENKVHHPQDG